MDRFPDVDSNSENSGIPVAQPEPTVSQVTVDDGTTIAYYSWDADAADALGQPPAVLLHGFGVHALHEWRDRGTVSHLLAAGVPVIAVDARGHGRSQTSPDPDCYGEARMALDVRAVLTHLGLKRVDLVGYSMGSVVAALAAAQDPRIRRLILGGVGAGLVELGGVDTRALPPELLIEALTAADPDTLPTDLQGLRGFITATGNDLPSLAAQAQSVHRTPFDLGRIAARTLVIAGDTDPLAERPQVLAQAIPGASTMIIRGTHETVGGSKGFQSAITHFLTVKIAADGDRQPRSGEDAGDVDAVAQ